MTPMQRFSLSEGVLFLLILAVAAGTRAGYLVVCDGNARQPAPLQVQGESMEERTALVGNLKEHRWFGSLAPFAPVEEQTAHVAPGYPWLLGLLAKLPGDLDATVRWIQCGLGALTAGLYFLFARRAFRSLTVAALAGLGCALYPFWIVNTAELNDGVLATFLLAACLWLGAAASQSGGYLTSFLYGLTLAGAALVRAALLPFAFVGLLWFLLRSRTLVRGWLPALLAFLGFANGLAPWTIRNLDQLKEVVPITDSLFYHLWMGNNPKATGGMLDDPTLLQALADQRGESPAETAQRLGEMPQKDRYASLARPVIEEVQRNPLGTLQRRLWAGLYFFFGESWFREQRLWQVREPAPRPPLADEAEERAAEPSAALPPWVADSYPTILTGTLLGVLLLGVLGWRWSYGWRYESMPAALAVLWVPLPYLLSHAEALQGPRLPLDGVLLCYAAFALACLVPGLGRYLWRQA